MSNIVPIRRPPPGALSRHDKRKVALFAQTVGKKLVGSEVDEAIEWCEIYAANPFVRDIYFFVFGEYGKENRRVVPVLSIGMYRKIAARTGNYRPDDTPPRFTYDEALKGPTNPKGIKDCEVSVFLHSHGEWHRVTSRLRWEERAPIIVEGAFKWEDTGETWPDTGKPKRKKVPIGDGQAALDPDKKNWHTMPETMLGKCVESDAIRKTWPEETAGSYVDADIDKMHVDLELTATEIVESVERADRMEKIGGPGISVDWCDGKPLQRVAVGKFGDAVLAFIRSNTDEPAAVKIWADRNRVGLQEYWAHDKAGALAVKKAIESATASL